SAIRVAPQQCRAAAPSGDWNGLDAALSYGHTLVALRGHWRAISRASVPERISMRMNVFRAAFVASIVLVAAIGSTGAEAKKAAENELAPSPAVYKILVVVDKFLAASDFRSAMDQLHAAQAIPNHTPEDDYLINGYLATIAVKQNDMA